MESNQTESSYNVRSQIEIFLSRNFDLMEILLLDRGFIMPKVEKMEDHLRTLYFMFLATANIARALTKLDYVNFDVEIIKMSQMFSKNNRNVSFTEIFNIFEAVLQGEKLAIFNNLRENFNQHE